MNFQTKIKSGDVVRLKGATSYATTTVDEVLAEDRMSVLELWGNGTRHIVHVGESYNVTCVTERGLYVFDAHITLADYSQTVARIELTRDSDWRKVQRREAFRLKAALRVRVRRMPNPEQPEEMWFETQSIDISETGIQILYDADCKEGDLLQVSIELNKFGILETLPPLDARVVRIYETGHKGGRRIIGLRFEKMPEYAAGVIWKLVMLGQRHMRQREQ